MTVLPVLSSFQSPRTHVPRGIRPACLPTPPETPAAGYPDACRHVVDRWTTGRVRVSWGILSVGLLAALGLLVLATVPNAPQWAVLTAVLLLAVIVVVGPAAALYAGTRPRPGHA